MLRSRQPATSIEVPDETPYPEEFWKSIARAYLGYVIGDGIRNPAVCIADEAGVPVKTARRWIAHCRSIGMLPKGKQGRAG
jgi:hypothetical protein